MSKYLIVTQDQRIPPDIQMFDYEVWSLQQFIEAAGSEEGINIDEGVWFNIDSINKDVYDAIHEGIEIPLKFYKFEDQNIVLDFVISEGISNYEIKKPEPPQEEIPIVENIQQQIPTQPPQMQPAQQPVAAPIQQPEIPQIPIQPMQQPAAPIQQPSIQERTSVEIPTEIGDLSVINSNVTEIDNNRLNELNLSNLLNTEGDTIKENTGKPAKVILFGSSKGGTGKTFTCLLAAYRYAKTHPTERVALADFDIIDGQVGITINKNNPTLGDYYKQYNAGNGTFDYLSNVIVKNDHFNSNLDFYLAPPMDVPEITNNVNFWQNVFELLIKNYDTVFFDSGIDYLGKPPISRLYKIADKIILTSNTSINSVKSIIRQLQTLSGRRKNNVFHPENKILDRVNLVLTRVSSNNATNTLVLENLSKYAPIVAAFGNIDDQISKSQWYQQWEIWDYETKVNSYLDKITSLD